MKFGTGDNVVQVAVDKRSGATTVSVSRALSAALPRFEADLPFVIAIVTLDLGDNGSMNLFTRVDDTTFEDLSIGDTVWFKTVDCGDGRVFFRFTAQAP